MRTREIFYNDSKALIIYIAKDESFEDYIHMQINHFKTLYNDVAVFVSGQNSMEITLTEMVNERR